MSGEDSIANHLKKNEVGKENSLYPNPIGKCFIGNGNNSQLIEEIFKSIGYERQIERIDEFQVKWVQCIQSINWNIFKDGEQMVNHIQGEDYFTTKLQLYQSLQTYEKISISMKKCSKDFLFLNQFLPQTFKLDEKSDRDAFFNTHQPGDLWICKPSELNQGKGIYLVREIDQMKEKFSQIDALDKRKQVSLKGNKRIIQRYISNPLLIHRKKFDIRCYMLIASVKPLIILYHSGYIRLSIFHFDNNDENLLTHLTNQFIQKKDPKYYQLKEETSWTMEQFNEYMNKHCSATRKVEENWVMNILPEIIERIMNNVIESIRMRLKRRVGCFGLYGYDFMIDEEMKVWLIEINVNPALTTNTNTLLQVIPSVVKESILISIECFEKIRHGEKVFPLKSVKGFKCIYNELKRKGSLPYLEQRRAISSSPNTRTTNIPFIRSNNNKNFPTNSSKSNERLLEEQKTIISYSLRQREDKNRVSDKLIRPLKRNVNSSNDNIDPLMIKYQTIQRQRPHLEILRPTRTVISEEWENLDSRQKNHFSLGPSKSVNGYTTVPSNHKSQKFIHKRNPREKIFIQRKSFEDSKKEEDQEETVRSTKNLRTKSNENSVSNRRKMNSSRLSSLTMNEDLNEYQLNPNVNQFHFSPVLTKSAFIYQLIRSRLEANLAKSISNNREKSTNRNLNSS